MIEQGGWWCDVCGSYEGLWHPDGSARNVLLHFDACHRLAPLGRKQALHVYAMACGPCASVFEGGGRHTEERWRVNSLRVVDRWRSRKFQGASPLKVKEADAEAVRDAVAEAFTEGALYGAQRCHEMAVYKGLAIDMPGQEELDVLGSEYAHEVEKGTARDLDWIEVATELGLRPPWQEDDE